ncbi:membrane protein, partial [Vibrio parahaemolyticus]|uniref:lysoplasmalogenase family protein n=1 Tax=Vibrio parahaemolyticus TaxID=670 RepID=UPI00062AFB99
IGGGLGVSKFADTQHSFKTRKLIYIAASLAAQVGSSKTFWFQLNGDIVWWLLALFLAASIVAIFLLLPQLDSLGFPVVTMGIMLVQLDCAAGEVWMQTPSYANAIGFRGTVIMTYSALASAIHGFRKHL